MSLLLSGALAALKDRNGLASLHGIAPGLRAAAAAQLKVGALAVSGAGREAETRLVSGPHPAAEHERQYRHSRSPHFGLRRARNLDTALSWTRARLIAYARRRLSLQRLLLTDRRR